MLDRVLIPSNNYLLPLACHVHSFSSGMSVEIRLTIFYGSHIREGNAKYHAGGGMSFLLRREPSQVFLSKPITPDQHRLWVVVVKLRLSARDNLSGYSRALLNSTIVE